MPERVIVAGSYPPIPVPAAAATLDAVRREIAEGREVRVVSPRPSAAHYSIPIAGVFAGRRLRKVGELSTSSRLVLCLEPGLPFSPPGERMSGLGSFVTAVSIARAMRHFEHSTVVVAGEPGASERAVALIRRAAQEVVSDVREGDPPAGVTARGPKEPLYRVRRLAGRAARGLLGDNLARNVRKLVSPRR